MSGRGGTQSGLFGLFRGAKKKASSLDTSTDVKRGSWGLDVPLEAAAFAEACRTQQKDGLSCAGELSVCSFLSRGLRYHGREIDACKAAAALALVIAQGPQLKPLADSGLLLAVLSCCKARGPGTTLCC